MDQVIEGNKLICDFMGLKTVKKPSPLSFEDVLFVKTYNEATKIWDNELPRYNTSLDWLKPVIDKIFEYSLAYPTEASKVTDMKIVVGIEYAWPKVVEFIKFLNTQTK